MRRIFQIAAPLVVVFLALAAISCNKDKITPAGTNFTPNPISPVPSATQIPSTEIKGTPGQPQTVDVISGKPVNRMVYTDYDGERLYFCCDESKKAVQKNPQWYLQKIREKGIALEKAPSRK